MSLFTKLFGERPVELKLEVEPYAELLFSDGRSQNIGRPNEIVYRAGLLVYVWRGKIKHAGLVDKIRVVTHLRNPSVRPFRYISIPGDQFEVKYNLVAHDDPNHVPGPTIITEGNGITILQPDEQGEFHD